MSNELKPCPFCGPVKGNPQVFPGPGNEGFFVHCITCGVSTDTFVGQEDAECAWHMRYAAPPAQGIDLGRQPTPMGWSDTDFLALGNPIPLRIFRKAVMRFKVMAELGVDVESMPMHFMKSQEKYAADVVEANRLLALIDGQRDAAPGVE